MSRRRVLATALAALLVTTTSAGDHGVTFLYPNATLYPQPDHNSLSFHYLDTINVTYLSPFATPLLFIFCSNGGHQIRHESVPAFNASHLVLLNWTESTTCYFDLRPDMSAGHGANSDGFLLDDTVAGQTTAGMPAATSTSTGGTSTSTSTTSQGTGAASTTTNSGASGPTGSTGDSSSGGGLSTGAQAGVGVGVALAVLLVGGLVGAWLWRRRRSGRGGVGGSRRPAELGTPEEAEEKGYFGGGEKQGPVGGTHELPSEGRPVEMGGNAEEHPRHELAG